MDVRLCLIHNRDESSAREHMGTNKFSEHLQLFGICLNVPSKATANAKVDICLWKGWSSGEIFVNGRESREVGHSYEFWWFTCWRHQEIGVLLV